MKYVFGPVPSRRLGQSLGIDTIPLKTCNWNCVYCQLGRTIPLTNERRVYVPEADVLAEVRAALAVHQLGEIDWVTFVGSGEPTLHSGTGRLIRGVKAMTDLPVAVITNGSLLYLPEVRRELAAADAVLPSLDAGDAGLYRRIDRPHPDITFERVVEGLIAFRREYEGKLWVEVMLVRGLNDSEEALRAIAAILRRASPDEIHISLPTRPPVETWVEPPGDEGLMRAQAILGEVARVLHPALGAFDLGAGDDPAEAAIAIIARHPMSEPDLLAALGRWAPQAVDEALASLAGSGRAQVVTRHGIRFWTAAQARYPAESQSRLVDPRRPHRRGKHIVREGDTRSNDHDG